MFATLFGSNTLDQYLFKKVLIYKEAAKRSGSKTRWQPSRVEKVPNPGPENGYPGDIN